MATATAKEPKKKPVAQAFTGKHRINEHAMLVALNIRRWHSITTDQKISNEVADGYKADKSMGKYRKKILDPHAWDKITKVVNQLRNFHYERTMAWSEGLRILSSAAFVDYMAQVSKLRLEFDAECVAFVAQYPKLKEDAKARLAGLYTEEDYPTVEWLKTRFGIEVLVQPIPSGDDFRVDLGDSEVKRIRKDIEKQAEATIEQAMKEVWGRLHDVVSHAAARLKAYKDDGDKVEHPFRDTLVTNITELLDIIPSLNITNDPKLLGFADQIRQSITAHSAVVLRDDAKIRESVAKQADEILEKMAGFLS